MPALKAKSPAIVGWMKNRKTQDAAWPGEKIIPPAHHHVQDRAHRRASKPQGRE
jgi:hypothetical protein